MSQIHKDNPGHTKKKKPNKLAYENTMPAKLFFCQEEVRGYAETPREQCSLLNRNLNPNLDLVRLFLNPVVAVFYYRVLPEYSVGVGSTHASKSLILRL